MSVCVGGAACFHRNREPFTCLPWGWGADVALRFPLGGQEEGQQSCHRRVPGAMSQRLCREVAGGGEWSWGSTSWPLCLPRMSPIANRGGLGHRHGGKGSGQSGRAQLGLQPSHWYGSGGDGVGKVVRGDAGRRSQPRAAAGQPVARPRGRRAPGQGWGEPSAVRVPTSATQPRALHS